MSHSCDSKPNPDCLYSGHGMHVYFFFKSVTCFPLYALAFHSWIMFKVSIIILLKKCFLQPEQASSCYCYLVINILDTILVEISIMSKSSIRIFLTVSLSTFSVSAMIYSLHCQYEPIYALFTFPSQLNIFTASAS